MEILVQFRQIVGCFFQESWLIVFVFETIMFRYCVINNNNKLFWMANKKLLPGAAAAWTAASLWCMVCEGLALNVMPGPKSHIHMCFVVFFTSSLRVSRSSHKFWQTTCCRCPTFSQRLATCTLFSFFSNALKWPILNPQIGDIICILALLFTWYICIFLNLYIPLYFYSVMFSLRGHLIIHHF